jgi:hypothetical protein
MAGLMAVISIGWFTACELVIVHVTNLVPSDWHATVAVIIA